MLFPAGAIFYAVYHYRLFDAEIIPEEVILFTGEEERKIFRNFSVGFYVLAFIIFFAKYLPFIGNREAFIEAFLSAITLFTIGVLIGLSQNIRYKSLKSFLTNFILLISIPVILYQFRDYAGISVWAFPIIIIISFTILNNQVMIYLLTFVTVLSQLVIWAFNPELELVVNNYDYILRIAITFIAFFTAIMTNKIYISKIEDNNKQIKFQEIVSNVLFNFVNVNQKNYQYKVMDLLEKIGVFFAVDRVHLYQINPDRSSMSNFKEWSDEGIAKESEMTDEIDLDQLPWWFKQLENENIFLCEDTKKLPKEAKSEQEYLKKHSIKSILSVPIIVNGKIHSVIGIQSVKKRKIWTDENIDMLNIMARILSSGIMHLKADKKIEDMAYYDSLTRLPNRVLFNDRIKTAIRSVEQENLFISVMFIDLDDFKLVNDTMGHDSGDELLKKVAERLSNQIRKVDTVSRFGGDEFLILFNNIRDYEDIPKIAKKILAIFSRPFIIKGQEFYITASGGIASFPIDGENPESLIKNADLAMYQAKEKGKNQYSQCTPLMKDEVQQNVKLSRDLHKVIDKEELSLEYQTQISLDRSEIKSVEALIRWEHPLLGMISPAVFLPLAERSNQIQKIGNWHLEKACEQIKKWQDMGLAKFPVSVNLSNTQFTSNHLIKDLQGILQKTGLAPNYLELEISEEILVKNKKIRAERLNQLKALGLTIIVDDFGGKKSSFTEVQGLAIDKLKVDINRIKEYQQNDRNKKYIEKIRSLLEDMDIKILVKGVETEEEIKFLQLNSFECIKGYYYYKGLSNSELEKLLIEPKNVDLSLIAEFSYES